MFKRNEFKILLLLIYILSLITITIYTGLPPSSEGVENSSENVSAERAFVHVNNIAKKPRPNGSEEIVKTREYILGELEELNITPKVQTYKGPIKNDWYEGNIEINNIIGVIKGTGNGEGKALMLSAHYDSVATGPGANDNAVAVSALLEAARAVKNDEPVKNDLWFVFTDAEELGMLGAELFWKEQSYRDAIGVVVNFEARGSKGTSMLFQTSDNNGYLIQEVINSESVLYANSFMGDIYKILPNDSDLTVALKYQIPGLNFAYIDGYEAYHTPTDQIENVNLSTLQHHSENALSMIKIFGNINLNNLTSSNEIYFNFLSSVMHYSESLAIPFTFIISLILVISLTYLVIKKKVSILGVLINFIPFASINLISLILCFGLYKLVSLLWVKNMTNYIGATYDAILYQICFLILTVIVYILFLKIFPLKSNRHETFTFGLLLFLVMLIFSSWLLPGASYLFLFPLTFSVLVFFVSLKSEHPLKSFGIRVMSLLQISVTTILFTSVFQLIFLGLPILTSVLAVNLLITIFFLNEPLGNLLTKSPKFITQIGVISIIVLLTFGWLRSESYSYPVYTDVETLLEEKGLNLKE